jgi:hypothetical protein
MDENRDLISYVFDCDSHANRSARVRPKELPAKDVV